jgi:hypothetical protein
MALNVFSPQFGTASASNGVTSVTQYISAVTGFQPPTGAIAFLFESDSLNAGSLRWRTSAAANVTLGHLCEPGRDSGYIPYGASSTFSVIPVDSGVTLSITLTWFTLT